MFLSGRGAGLRAGDAAGESATLSVGGATAAITGVGEDFEALGVTLSGNGSGTVMGGGISCPGTCSIQVARTTMTPTVTLVASPSTGSVFSGWTGACTGTGPCTVTMSQTQSVNAEFDVQQALTVSFHALSGLAATLTSSPAGISCSGASCTQTANFVQGTTVTLNVSGVSAPALVGWSNACAGTTCAIQINAATTISATATQNNIVFSSSTTATGGGGLAGADSVCAAAAKSSGLPGNYVAFLATSTATAYSRLGSARGWIRPDGLPFADTVASMEAYVTYYPPSLDETAGPNPAFGAWTGVPIGTDATATCSNWSSASPSANGWGGVLTGGSTQWVNEFENGCNSPLPFYCFETDFTSAVTVPAVNGRHAFVSSKAMTIAGISAADTECQSEASAAGLANPTHFLALLSTTTASAASRYNLSGANWIRPDGVVLASSTNAFMANTLMAPVSVMANGQPMPNGFAYAWTGGFPSSASPAASWSCNDWSSTASSATGELGAPATETAAATMQQCSGTNLVICVED